MGRPVRDVTALDRHALDITDSQAVAATLDNLRPAVVVNAAAYTAVDAAEEDEAAARAVNATGVGNLATHSAQVGATLVHVSTDYVFDGQSDAAYTEARHAEPAERLRAHQARR